MDYARTRGARAFLLLCARGRPFAFRLFPFSFILSHHHRRLVLPTRATHARPTGAADAHTCTIAPSLPSQHAGAPPFDPHHLARSIKCAGGRQAHVGTHARLRNTRRTEMDDEGSAGRRFGPVCRRFRIYKHPTCTHIPQQSTLDLTFPFPSSPRPVRASSPHHSASLPCLSPLSPTSSATRGPTADRTGLGANRKTPRRCVALSVSNAATCGVRALLRCAKGEFSGAVGARIERGLARWRVVDRPHCIVMPM
jgi:hypothetical protein